MGRIAGSIKNDKEKEFNEEKENICFLSTLLMGVGESLAGVAEKKGSSSKRQKTS